MTQETVSTMALLSSLQTEFIIPFLLRYARHRPLFRSEIIYPTFFFLTPINRLTIATSSPRGGTSVVISGGATPMGVIDPHNTDVKGMLHSNND